MMLCVSNRNYFYVRWLPLVLLKGLERSWWWTKTFPSTSHRCHCVSFYTQPIITVFMGLFILFFLRAESLFNRVMTSDLKHWQQQQWYTWNHYGRLKIVFPKTCWAVVSVDSFNPLNLIVSDNKVEIVWPRLLRHTSQVRKHIQHILLFPVSVVSPSQINVTKRLSNSATRK